MSAPKFALGVALSATLFVMGAGRAARSAPPPAQPAPTLSPSPSAADVLFGATPPGDMPTSAATAVGTVPPQQTPPSTAPEPTPPPTFPPAPVPTVAPTLPPTPVPTEAPTLPPTPMPTEPPTLPPTPVPTEAPTLPPTPMPTVAPTLPPTPVPVPTVAPTLPPTPVPVPTVAPTPVPFARPLRGAAPKPVAPVAVLPPLTETARIAVAGHPFSPVFSSDGTAIFASVDVDLGGGVAVLTQAGDHFNLTRFVAISGTPGGMALTADGSTLVVANGGGLALLDTKSLEGSGDANVRYVSDSPNDGSIEVVVAPNGYAYFTNENTGTLGVADLGSLKVVSHVNLDSGPVGLALTPDGKSLFVTSEVAATAIAGHTCRGLAGAIVREGTLSVVDAAAAITDPGRALKNRAAAGCSPSRVAVNAKGDVVWVTARDDNSVLAFDGAHFATLANNPPFVLTVGKAPIGVALVRDGSVLVVANSNRYADDSASTLTLIDTATAFTSDRRTLAPVPTGGFPREFALSRDGAKLALTNYRTNSIQIFSIAP